MDFSIFSEWDGVTIAAAGVALAVFAYAVIGWLHEVNRAKNQIDQVKKETREELRPMNQRIDNVNDSIVDTNRQIAETDRRITKSIAETKEQVKGLGSQVAETKEQVNVLGGQVSQVLGLLMSEKVKENEENPDAHIIELNSPPRLTPLGWELADEIRAKEEADKCVGKLLPRALDMEPYDIEQLSFVHMACDYKPDAELNKKIRAIAYERGVSHYKILGIIGIILRDKLLEAKEQAQKDQTQD